MSASGRTKVASDVKFGVGASFIKLYLWSKFGDPSSYSIETHKSLQRRRRRRSTRPMPRTPSPTPLGSGVKNYKSFYLTRKSQLSSIKTLFKVDSICLSFVLKESKVWNGRTEGRGDRGENKNVYRREAIMNNINTNWHRFV